MLSLDQEFPFRGHRIAWGAIGDGEPMVLAHGFPWSAQSWRRIAPHLARTRRVFYFDMPGAGASEKNAAQDVSEAAQSDLLAALINHWDLRKPHVAGHDFGGLAALRAHFVNGVEYGKLYLMDAVAVLPSGSPFYTHVKRHEAAFAGLPSYAHEALFRAYIQNAAHAPLQSEAIHTYLAPYSGAEGQPAFYRQIAHADQRNIAEVQDLYRRPPFEVRLAWGEHDEFIPPKQGEELRARLGADALIQIPNAAHLIQEDAPEAVLAFLMC